MSAIAIALRYAARSDIGLGRYKNNQDSAYAGPHLLVVADGMGGHAGGDIASSIAVGRLALLDDEAHGSDALDHLRRTIHEAHALMQDRVDSDSQLAGMGTTVTALLRSGRRLALAHIGDSRAYLLSGDEFTQVTHDHTLVQWLVDEGRITPEEAQVHPQRSVVMKVIGDVDAPDEPDTSVREAHVGDRWLLCSDGLSGFVSDETLEHTLREVGDPGECADRLIQLALRAGGQDNITCIVADVVEVSTTPPSTPQVVGAVALERQRRTAASGSPAAKAAALSRRDDGEQDEEDEEEEEDDDSDPDRPGRRRWGWGVAGLLVVAVLVAVGYAGYVWTQNQYYVGANKQDVAIFRGLQQDIGPVDLSSVYEEQKLPLDTLPALWRERVDSGIPANDLDHARGIVVNLLQHSTLCQAAGPAGAAEASSGPTATRGGEQAPEAASTPTRPPSPTVTANPRSGAATLGPTAGPSIAPTTPTPTSTPTNSQGQPLPADCFKQ